MLLTSFSRLRENHRCEPSRKVGSSQKGSALARETHRIYQSRFYDPDKGTITFDGKDIARLDIADYRSAMSLVSQEPTLYQGDLNLRILSYR